MNISLGRVRVCCECGIRSLCNIFSVLAISIDQYFAEHFVPGGVMLRGMGSKFPRSPLSYLNVRLTWNHPVRRTRDSCDIFQNETALSMYICMGRGPTYSSSLDFFVITMRRRLHSSCLRQTSYRTSVSPLFAPLMIME